MSKPTEYRNYNDDEEEEEIPPVFIEQGYHNFIVVDNLPQVPQPKDEKLLTVLKKIFAQIGETKEIFMPLDEKTKTTKGFAFVEFAKAEHANAAVQKLDGYALDKSHTFKVNKYSDIEKLDKLPDQYVEPETPSDPPAGENLYDWLLEKYGNDQFVTMYDNQSEILLNGVGGERARTVFKRADWTEKYLAWSPLGTYLATLHAQGVILWGGPNFNKLKKFGHANVDLIDFSPQENYLITFSARPVDGNLEEAVVIWDIRSGQRLRGFPKSPAWPAFRWSYDDKYFARLNQHMISVYEAPSMNLLDKKSIKLHGPIQDFSWSPGANVLACWVPEQGNVAARVVVLRIPDRKELAQKNLFNVVDCKLHWQNQGEYLCVKVDRIKSKKQTFTAFELFRMKEKDIPVEALELEDIVIAFAWEPKGKRFALIHAEQPNSPRPSVSFYTMGDKRHKHLATLEKRPANHLFWAPSGRFIVLAGLRNLNGQFEFYNSQELESMGTGEHEMATNVEWDPTGRYCVTYVSQWNQTLENGYVMWSFNGKKVHTEVKSKFFLFSWRPRPPSLLTREDEKDIQKNFKQIAEEYKKEDERKTRTINEEKKARKLALRNEFEAYMQQKRKEYEAEAEKRHEVLGYDSDDDKDNWYTVEEVVEEVIETYEEVVDE